MQLIEEYDSIVKVIGEDLGWYLAYYALERAQQILHISVSEADETPAKNSLFTYTACRIVEDLLSQRLFHDEKVRVTRPCFTQMVIHMSKAISHIPTFSLSSYLEYMDAWVQQDLDWNVSRPVAMKEMEIVHYD